MKKMSPKNQKLLRSWKPGRLSYDGRIFYLSMVPRRPRKSKNGKQQIKICKGSMMAIMEIITNYQLIIAPNEPPIKKAEENVQQKRIFTLCFDSDSIPYKYIVDGMDFTLAQIEDDSYLKILEARDEARKKENTTSEEGNAKT